MKKVYKLLDLNHCFNLDELTSEMDKAGCRHATLTELLNFCANNPELQGQSEIVALGSVRLIADDGDCVPCLSTDDDVHWYNIHWLCRVWCARYRFLGIKK